MIRAGKIIVGGLVGLLLLCAGVTAISDFLIADANPPTGRLIATSAGPQHVLDVGPDFADAAGAPTVVLLHGATANLQDMRLALADRLRTRYRVIAVDRPGHGWSARGDGEADAQPRRQADVLHEILRKAGVTRPIVLAHSWGGSVALAYALAYPNELSGLVLLAPVTYRWQGENSHIVDIAASPWLGPLFAHTLAVPIAWLLLDPLVTRAFAPEHPPPDYIDHAAILLALRSRAITTNAQDLEQMALFPAAQTLPYAQIKVPVVVIAGTEDHLVSSRLQAETFARQMPKAKLILLPGVGHMVHYVAPERVTGAIDSLAEAASVKLGSGRD
jgi:pimeloyl-ACP methyl ester carboxylesterase